MFLHCRFPDASMKFVPQCSTAHFNGYKAKCCLDFKKSRLKCLAENRQEGMLHTAILLLMVFN